jgi:hypothetical protein
MLPQDGAIGAEELLALLQSLMGATFSDQQLERVARATMQQFDEDGDGRLTVGFGGRRAEGVCVRRDKGAWGRRARGGARGCDWQTRARRDAPAVRIGNQHNIISEGFSNPQYNGP